MLDDDAWIWNVVNSFLSFLTFPFFIDCILIVLESVMLGAYYLKSLVAFHYDWVEKSSLSCWIRGQITSKCIKSLQMEYPTDVSLTCLFSDFLWATICNIHSVSCDSNHQIYALWTHPSRNHVFHWRQLMSKSLRMSTDLIHTNLSLRKCYFTADQISSL